MGYNFRIMLVAIACLFGIAVLLLTSELLGKYKILKGEYHRKFVHISAGTFIAFWPWLISWQAIQVIGLIMLVFMITNRYFGFLNYHGKVGRASYGDILLALAVTLCAFITTDKIFFMLAILQVSLADGIAAIAGTGFGKGWGYKVLGSKKTVIGSMVFWLVSVCVFGAGLLPAHDIISLRAYYFILLLLPPLFTLMENVSVYGLDNILIPLLVVIILRAVQA